jgi:nucleoside-diphosphate-sugar epimerase
VPQEQPPGKTAVVFGARNLGRAVIEALLAQGWAVTGVARSQATLIQVTGGSARRAMAGRGLWAAGAFGVRAITNAAALELRPQEFTWRC